MVTRTNSQGSEPTIVDGAQQVAEVGVRSGRNTSSLTNNYDAVHTEVNGDAFLDNVATAQNIGAGGTTPIFLESLHVQVALVGTLTITGFKKVDGTAITKVYPIGSVGQLIAPGNGFRLEAGCTMTLSVANDGGSASNLWNVRVGFRPIG